MSGLSSSAAGAKPKCLLMTTDTVGGVFTYAVELCRGLGLHGTRVVLATMGAPLSEEQRAELSAMAHVEVHASSYRLEWMDNPWRDVHEAGNWLMDLEAAYKPDLIHLNHYAHGALPWRAPVLMTAHSCVLSWWRAVKGEDAPPAWATYHDHVTAGLARASMVVAPSRAMLDEILRLYAPSAPAQVIYNGRELKSFRSGIKKPLIFAAGRLWDEAKNLSALHACSGRLPWPVCLAGPVSPPGGPEREGLPRTPRSNVYLLGQLPSCEVASWLSHAAIYALPARYEPFGFSVLEAALSGCALVLGDIPSLREIWGDAAVYVQPNNPESLRGAIVELTRNSLLRARMTHLARQRAQHYTVERMVCSYLKAYRALLGGSSSALPILGAHSPAGDRQARRI